MGKETGEKRAVVLGGGLSGLSAGYALSKSGFDVRVVEAEASVGGLSRTIERDGFRFDLGGHRFLTRDARIESFVLSLMEGEMERPLRTSVIRLNGRYFDYPLKPLNSVFGLGAATSARILFDYSVEKFRSVFGRPEPVSLEDWVVRNFGKKMFEIYFKPYSEKVWGIECSRISRDWVEKRIEGLSLWKALKHAFIRMRGKDIPTLADSFHYPRLGIGRISERLQEGIKSPGGVLTNTKVKRINIKDGLIVNVEALNCGNAYSLSAGDYISSIPLTEFLNLMNPAPPGEIIEAASRLRFRDLIIAAIAVNKPHVTGQSWIYFPDSDIPFGRIHEPKNWSESMAPDGKSLVVAEYFCFRTDDIWKKPDEAIASLTIEHMGKLGFAAPHEIVHSTIIRVPSAYPLFDTGYKERSEKVINYLSGIRNLHIVGRSGLFEYLNMDAAIGSGLDAAERISARADASAR